MWYESGDAVLSNVTLLPDTDISSEIQEVVSYQQQIFNLVFTDIDTEAWDTGCGQEMWGWSNWGMMQSVPASQV